MISDPKRELEEKRAELEKLQSAVVHLENQIAVEGLDDDVSLYDKIGDLQRLYVKKDYQEIARRAGDIIRLVQLDRTDIIDEDPNVIIEAGAKEPPGHHWPQEFKLAGMEMERGTPIVVGAGPGVGKTSLGLNFALDAADHQKSTAFFSYEMTPRQCWLKLYLVYMKKVENVSMSFADISDQVRLDPEVRAKIKTFATNLNKYVKIIDCDGWPASKVCTVLDVIAGNMGGQYPEFAIIDYLQLVEPEGGHDREDVRNNMILAVRRFRSKAKRTGTNFIELSQMSGENFMESREIEHAAAMALVLFRAREKKTNSFSTLMKIKVKKSRFTHGLVAEVQMDGPSGAIGVDKVALS